MTPFWRKFEYDVGTTVNIAIATSVAGVGSDVASLTVTVKSPGGVLSTAAVVHDADGQYHVEVVPMTPGRWSYRAVAVAPSSAREGSFLVRESRVLSLVG